MLRCLALVFVALGGCDQTAPSEVVATVGKREITAKGLREFVIGLPPGLRTSKVGREARQDYLQTLIDRELLLAEAYRLSLDADPTLLKQLEAGKREFILSVLQRQVIRPQLQLSEKEIRSAFEEQGLHRERLLAAIVLDSEDRARQVRARIEAGGSFAELARDHSTDAKSAAKGGLIGFFNRPTAKLTGGVPDSVFNSLRTGFVSEPIAAGSKYLLVSFLDERAVALGTLAPKISYQLLSQKARELAAQKVELLAHELNWRIAPEGLALLRNRSRGGVKTLNLTDEERQTPIFRYGESAVTLDRYLDLLPAHRIKTLRAAQDSSFIEKLGRNLLRPEVMLMEIAAHEGIPELPVVREWVRAETEELLLKRVRKLNISDRVVVSDEEVRRYYKDNLEKFRIPEKICFGEAAADSRARAESLRAEVDDDTDLLQFSRVKGLDVRRRSRDGSICMHSPERVAYPALWKALTAATVGRVSGPVPLKGNTFSIFKVLRREPEHQEPFESARQRSRASLVQHLERRHFDEWLSGLRQRYDEEVTVFSDRLAAALPDALLASSSEVF